LRIVTHYINYIKPILNYSIFDRITIKKSSFESYEKLYTSLLLLLTTALWAQDNNRNDYQQQEFKLAQNLLENMII
jgi:hypothetical protein